MPQWTSVLLFVSSTFHDMRAERDYLVKRVFPQLQEWCERSRIRFVDVDLRWGITENDITRNKDVIRVCLRSVDQCRPFFICFLGQRRGTILKPADISPPTLEEFPEFAPDLGSASVTEIEILHALRGAAPQYAFFYERDPSYLDTMPSEAMNIYKEDREPSGEEISLRWRQRVAELHRPIRHYHATSDADGRLGQFRQGREGGLPLAEVVLGDLKAAIRNRFANEPERFRSEHLRAAESPLERELEQQEQFLYEHSEDFVERSGDFDALDAYLADTADDRVFALVGESGTGKSTLLARWIRRCRESLATHYRFIGSSDHSGTADEVLKSVARELFHVRRIRQKIPDDALQLRRAWPSILAEAGERGPIVLVFDALNQLSAGVTDLTWLPAKLPPNVKIVVSALQEWREERLLSSSMKPFEDLADRRRLVDAYLRQYLKQMDEPVLEALIASPATGNPLYLKIVLSELRLFGSNEDVARRIAEGFGAVPVTAFDALLQRLERDRSYTPLNSDEAAPLVFGLLAHARGGLHREELADLVVERHPQLRAADALDTVNFHLRQVRSFLARRSGRDDFLHETFKLAAAQRYGEQEPWHEMLAAHFRRRAAAPSLDSRELYDVHVSGNPISFLAKRWMRNLFDWKAKADALEILIGFNAIFEEISGLRGEEAVERVQSLFATGSCDIERLSGPQAAVAVRRLEELGWTTNVTASAPRPLSSWPSRDPRHYSELLHHQLEGKVWSALVDSLTDDGLMHRCFELLEPRQYVDCFKSFVASMPSEADGRRHLATLRMRLPINEYTQPLMIDLAQELTRAPEEGVELLSYCARAPEHHIRAVIGLRAVHEAARKVPVVWSADARRALDESMPILLASKEKRTRWEAVHSYPVLMPQAGASPLVAVTISETEHPLVRAEAARRLGEINDPVALDALHSIADSAHYPLRRYARRSARLIGMGHGMIPPGPPDEWIGATSMPEDLGPLLEALGVDSSKVGPQRWKAREHLLIHLVPSEAVSAEANWDEVRALETIFRFLPCRLVLTESGTRDDSLTPIKHLAQPEAWRDVAARFLHDLKLGGEEYLQLDTDIPFAIHGVETAAALQEMFERKQRGLPAADLVGSVARAQRMLENTLRHLRAAETPVGVLITHVVGGYQIARLLGEEQQFGGRQFDRFLPEIVPRHLVKKQRDLRYVAVRLEDPAGDLFDLDVNYRHTVYMSRMTSLKDAVQTIN